MLQLIAFESVQCDVVGAEELLGDFLTYAKEVQVRAGLYIGSVPVVIDPGENFRSVCARYRKRVRKDKVEKAQYDRRRMRERRLFHRDDGHERRSVGA